MSEELRFFYKRGLEKMDIILENLREDYRQKGKRNPIEHKKTRFKSDNSIYEKLHRKKREEYKDEEITQNINDVIGARIVCPFLSDIEDIKEKLRNHPDLKFIDEKDYIKEPKESGYRSYHIHAWVKVVIDNKERWVKTEIQIRTILMDMWASLEHKIFYKKGITLSKETESQIKELALLCQILDEELDKKKTDEKIEENSLKNILTSEEYSKMTKKYEAAQEHVMTEIRNIYKEYKYNETVTKEANPIEHIEKRIKPIDSLVKKLYNKMQEGIITNADDAINDIAGVRVVCSFKSDLIKIADIIEHKLGFEVVAIKDYFNNPKENGYSGYHIIVAVPYHHADGSIEKLKVEIQIRTIAMDMWAIVERNLRFKDLTPEERQKQLSRLARIRKKIDDQMEIIIEESKKLREKNNKKLVKTPTEKQ